MTDWHEVATGFMARSRQIGDRVDIEIVSRLAQPGGDGAIGFIALSTLFKRVLAKGLILAACLAIGTN